MNKHVLQLNKKQRGLPPLSYLLQRFYPKDQVVIKPNPKDKNQLPHYRFFGKIGTVIEVNNPQSIKVLLVGKVKRSRSHKIVTTSNLHLKLIKRP